nr:hypothetical protein [Bacteroidales bacterium]
MEKSTQNSTRKYKSLMTLLLGITMTLVTVLVVALSVFLFRVIRSHNLQVAKESMKDVVVCNVDAIGTKYRSAVLQLAGLAAICARHHYDEQQCVDLVQPLIGTSNGVYLYGGYVRHDGTVVSTVVDTINVVYKKFAMEQLCKYGKN